MLVYAVAVFVSFLAGLLAMARFSRQRGSRLLTATNLLGAIAVAFTLAVNLGARLPPDRDRRHHSHRRRSSIGAGYAPGGHEGSKRSNAKPSPTPNRIATQRHTRRGTDRLAAMMNERR